MTLIDHWVAACLAPLAIWILISGLDDLAVDLAWFCGSVRRRLRPPTAAPAGPAPPERQTAIFVPLWREHAVIGSMLEHNLAAIRYGNYQIFAGCYPNDEPTVDAVLEARSARVHIALCPHNGPTSKADCLNWIYQRMLLYEEERGVRFELVVIHDAEDLIHPEELNIMNRHTGDAEMVQVPVLPLPTPLARLTHGVYCDEFAEYQSRDMPVRQALGGFIPSNGVGTGYARTALEKLAARERNRIFEPGCLTEDYENGLRLHLLGCRQLFVPIRIAGGGPVATREYFPQRLGQALRQRTRWVTGNALQAWERHGWAGGIRQRYWLWRDRKGLLGNPVTFTANLVLAYGIATWSWSAVVGSEWGLPAATRDFPAFWMLYTTLVLQLVRIAVRFGCVTRIYGWGFAAGVPLRVLWANCINSLATASALARYATARLRRRPLAWLKTEHVYPSRAALMQHKQRLGEILVRAGFIGEEGIAQALASKPATLRLGEQLLALGRLTENQIYQALSLQQNLPFETLDPAHIPRRVARALPASVARKWKVLPFRIGEGRLYLAGPELPSDDMQRDLQRFTRLELRFHLTTPANLAELSRRLL